VIDKFVTAVQKKDKATADSLESPASKAFFQKNTGTTSFYQACQKLGEDCTTIFKASALAKAPKQYKDYTPSSGPKGKQVVYVIDPLAGIHAGQPGCNNPTIIDLTIAVVPKGSSWLIDNVDEGLDASANKCTTGTSSSAAPVTEPTTPLAVR
jgi:hypothetical protein